MTHSENRADWYKEGAIGFGVGILYGVTNVCVGHPFDTIKTKMQAQTGFERVTMLKSFTRTFQQEGLVGLYRGCVPPIWGSGIYRSLQFATFEAGYTYMDNSLGRKEIPLTAGLQIRVVCSGIIASIARSIVECPLEYAKVKRQTGQKWTFGKLYTGYGITLSRTMGLMTTYFILIDSGRRHMNEEFQKPLIGPFLLSGCAATLAWWIIWPLEVVKSQVQSGYGRDESILNRMRAIVKERGGLFGLYRGLAPGSIRSFLANGTSMIVMSFAQKKVTELGWRHSGTT